MTVLRAAALILLVCSAAGCATPAPTADRAAKDPAPDDGARPGLEVVWWVADDSIGTVGAALAPFLDPPQPSDLALRERWRVSGLRMARVPIERLPDLERAAPALSERYRAPVGWSPAWREVFRGRRIGGEPVMVLGEPRTFAPGVVRLLARCWPVVAGEPGAGSIHLDAAVQRLAGPSAARDDPFTRPEVTAEEQRGEVLRELTLTGRVEPGFAYVITCDSPDATWKPRRVPMTEETGFSPPADLPTPTPTKRDAYGPSMSLPLTLGEAMLGSPDTETSARRLKGIVVLITRGSRREVRLLP